MVRETRIVDMGDSPYLIAGMGSYVSKLLASLRLLKRPEPCAIIDTTGNQSGTEFYHTVVTLDDVADYSSCDVIIGSDEFKYEIIDKLKAHHWPEDKYCTLNMSDILVCEFSDGLLDLGKYEKYIIYYSLSSYHEDYIGSLFNYLRSKGVGVLKQHVLPASWSSDIPWDKVNCGILWNGILPEYSEAKVNLQQHGKPFLFAEFGFFPQRKHIYLDGHGINLARVMSLPETARPLAELELSELRKEMLGDRTWMPSDYILVPLQIQSDSNVHLYSSYGNNMQQFIDDVISDFPGERLVFKAHPLDKNAKTYNYHGFETSSEDFISLALQAKLVCGINSTTLFEARLADIPVRFYGDSLLTQGEDQHEVLLQIIYNQMRVDGSNFEIKLAAFRKLLGF